MTTASRTTLCPSCGASVRVDAPWCSLCHADLRPAPEPVVVTPYEPAVVADPLTAPLLDLVLPRMEQHLPVAEPAPPAPAETPAAEAYWPCARCQSPNAITADMCVTCGFGFLGAPERLSLMLPVVGDLTALSRGRRFGVAGIVAAAVVVPVALITLLLTGAPPEDTGPTLQESVSTAP